MIQQLLLTTLFSCNALHKKNEDQKVLDTLPHPADNPSGLVGKKMNKGESLINLSDFHNVAWCLNNNGDWCQDLEWDCNFICEQIHGRKIGRSDYCEAHLDKDYKAKLTKYRKDFTSTTIGKAVCIWQSRDSRVIHGRTPLGIHPSKHHHQDKAECYAQQARDETLSIFAFAQLLQFLTLHNAPEHLLRGCAQAMMDETRHAQIMYNLAVHHGAQPPTIRVPQAPNPSLLQVAQNNAVHGCIYEAWSALMVMYRAAHSTSNQEVFTEIARDEIFHAELAWDIHHFLMPLLTEEQQNRVRKEMVVALQQLEVTSQDHPMQVSPEEDLRLLLIECFRRQLQELVAAA